MPQNVRVDDRKTPGPASRCAAGDETEPMKRRRNKDRDRSRARPPRAPAPDGAARDGTRRGAAPGGTTYGAAAPGGAPVRYRARRVKTSGRVLAIVIALVALTVVAAIALAVAFAPSGDTGGATSAAEQAAATGRKAVSGSSTHPASPSASPTPAASSTPSVTVVSGGDTMGDRGVKAYLAAHGADAVFAGIAPVLRAADAAWVNLESPLTAISDPYPGKDVHFQGDPRLATGLAYAGVDVVNMANNHAVDQGQAALLDSIRRVEAAGIKVVGVGKNATAARAPAIVRTSSGATIGFLGWTTYLARLRGGSHPGSPRPTPT